MAGHACQGHADGKNMYMELEAVQPLSQTLFSLCPWLPCTCNKEVRGSNIPATRGKIKVPGGRTFMHKKQVFHLPDVFNHKLWGSQLCLSPICLFTHGGFRLVVVHVVAQEVDGLAVPCNGTHIFPVLVFLSVTFGQPLAKFLRVVLAAWHDDAHC